MESVMNEIDCLKKDVAYIFYGQRMSKLEKFIKESGLNKSNFMYILVCNKDKFNITNGVSGMYPKCDDSDILSMNNFLYSHLHRTIDELS